MALELFATPFFDSGGAPVAKPCYGEPTDIVVDIPLGNIDSNSVVITNTLDARPTVYVDRHADASNPSSGAGWRHFAFAIDQVADDTPKRPIFRINHITTGAVFLGGYRAVKTTDYATWDQSDRWTQTTPHFEWEYSDALSTGRTFIHSNPTARYAEMSAFATTILANPNVNPSTNANASGVYATSPSATNHNGTQVGLKPQLGVNMKFGGATTDGQPKRKMVVMAGIHAAGESQQWYAFKGFIEYILNSADIEAQNLRSNWDFYVYWCTNPDGWEGGDYRGAFSYTSFTNGTFFAPAQPAWQPIEDLKAEIAADIPTFDVSVTVNWHGEIFAVNSDWITYTGGSAASQGLGYDAVVTAGQGIFTNAQINQTTSATDPHDMRYGIEVLGANATNPTSVSNECPVGNQSTVAFYQDIGTKWARSYSVADQTGIWNSGISSSVGSAQGTSTATATSELGGTEAVGSSAGTSAASAVSELVGTEAVGLSTGTSTASAFAVVSLSSTGSSSGVSSVIAFSDNQSPVISSSESGLVFLYDDSVKNAVLSSTSTASGFNIEDLKTNNINDIWMSSSLSDQVITATWTSFQTIDFVAIPFSNLVVGSSFRVRTYLTSGSSTPTYDSGFIDVTFAIDPPIGFDTIGYVSFAYGGGNHLSHLFDEKQSQKIDITFRSPSNPDGAIHVSRIMAGKSIRLERGASYGANVIYEDDTNITKTDGGGSIPDIKPNNKEIDFEIKFMPDSDKKKLSAMTRRTGKRVPVFASLRSNAADAEEKQHFEAFGRIEDDGLSRTSYNLDTTKIKLIQ